MLTRLVYLCVCVLSFSSASRCLWCCLPHIWASYLPDISTSLWQQSQLARVPRPFFPPTAASHHSKSTGVTDNIKNDCISFHWACSSILVLCMLALCHSSLRHSMELIHHEWNLFTCAFPAGPIENSWKEKGEYNKFNWFSGKTALIIVFHWKLLI